MDFRRRRQIAPYDESDESSVAIPENSPQISPNMMNLASPQNQPNDMMSSPILAQLAS